MMIAATVRSYTNLGCILVVLKGYELGCEYCFHGRFGIMRAPDAPFVVAGSRKEDSIT